MYKNEECVAKYHISDFDLGWLVGFIEGEGCFFIAIREDKREIKGYNVRPFFCISLGIKDKNALMNIKEMLGKCNIPSSVHENYMSKDRSCYVNCFLNLGSNAAFKLRNLLKNCDFKTKKKQDFLLWSEAIDIMRNGEHLTYEGLLKVVDIKDRMNIRKRKIIRKYTHDFFVSKKDEIMARFELRNFRNTEGNGSIKGKEVLIKQGTMHGAE